MRPYIQLDPISADFNGEKHYWFDIKFLGFTLFRIEIGISNNALAGVILNPKHNHKAFEPKQIDQNSSGTIPEWRER